MQGLREEGIRRGDGCSEEKPIPQFGSEAKCSPFGIGLALGVPGWKLTLELPARKSRDKICELHASGNGLGCKSLATKLGCDVTRSGGEGRGRV